MSRTPDNPADVLTALLYAEADRRIKSAKKEVCGAYAEYGFPPCPQDKGHGGNHGDPSGSEGGGP